MLCLSTSYKCGNRKKGNLHQCHAGWPRRQQYSVDHLTQTHYYAISVSVLFKFGHFWSIIDSKSSFYEKKITSYHNHT